MGKKNNVICLYDTRHLNVIRNGQDFLTTIKFTFRPKCEKPPICGPEFSSSLFSGREKKTLKRNVEIALWDKEKKNK